MSGSLVRRLSVLMALCLAGPLLGCGGDDSSKLSVNLYGWHDDGTPDGAFVQGLPDYPGAELMRVRVTRPSTREVLTEQTVPLSDRRIAMDSIPLGQDLRMDFEVRSATGTIAGGSTPLFSFGSTSRYRAFRAMISPVNEFAPVGSMVRVTGTGEDRLVPSRLDRRELAADWIGRVGHTATPTEDGQVLIVGGGLVNAAPLPGSQPPLTEVFDDIQLFDPATGYFTELAGDDAARQTGTVGADRLQTGRAYHSVTPLGGDRFLVVGGFRVAGGTSVATGTIELIDLNAAPGTRVQVLVDSSGSAMSLNSSRAMHSATRLESGAVIVAGGRGGSSGQVLNSFEIIQTHPQNAHATQFPMSTARVGHAAVLLEDGESVWVLGGSNDDVLQSTEVLSSQGSATASDLDRPRLEPAVYLLGASGSFNALVVGGMTGVSGGATGTYAFGRPDSGFTSTGQLSEARGGATLVELPQSRRLLILGGLDSNGDFVRSAEVLTFQGLQAAMGLDGPFGTTRYERAGFAAALTDTGRVLLVGGKAPGEAARDDAEFYNPRDPVVPPRQ